MILDSSTTFQKIYKAAEDDRERAIETFDLMKERLEKTEKITPGMLEALNGSQQLIQSSTDKLVQLASLISKKESQDSVDNLNKSFSDDMFKTDIDVTKSKRAKDFGIRYKR
jgi:hypothetical protein